jgi:hypothetical protein
MTEMNKSAVVSECGQFRYILRRSWDISRPALGFIMLNPSTADADQDDPTIRKCVGFAERLGFGAIVVTNLFAHRATDPANLKRAGYPRGPENDEWIRKGMREASQVVCAWGSNARGLVRPAEVLLILSGHRVKRQALALTDDGIPRHPLMLPYTCSMMEFDHG